MCHLEYPVKFLVWKPWILLRGVEVWRWGLALSDVPLTHSCLSSHVEYLNFTFPSITKVILKNKKLFFSKDHHILSYCIENCLHGCTGCPGYPGCCHEVHSVLIKLCQRCRTRAMYSLDSVHWCQALTLTCLSPALLVSGIKCGQSLMRLPSLFMEVCIQR